MSKQSNAVQKNNGQNVPTMREVAALANVSLKTVSRVVNNEAGVSAALTERVLKAVNQLGYQHNTNASNLRRADQRTATIGLLLEDVANPFSSVLHRSIEDVARHHNSMLLAGSHDGEGERETEFINALATRRVDGMIIIPTPHNSASMARAWLNSRPVVFADRAPSVPEADSVTVDNRVGAANAVAQLARFGHQRIAFLGDDRTIWTSMERYLGYVEGLARQGLRLIPTLVQQGLKSIEAAASATHAMLHSETPPTAIFSAQNLVTIGVIYALQQLNLQQQVALIGFDDFEMAALLDPKVSVIAQDPILMGQTAAELLFARLGGDQHPPQHIVLPTRLIARGSGEIAAA